MKGILFTPEMARAVCAGTKTVTRRVIVPQPVIADCTMSRMWRVSHGPCGHYFFSDTMAPDIVKALCEYKVGERRCLLTTWAVYPGYDDRKPSELPPNFDARLDQRINAPDKIWHAGLGLKPEWCGKLRPGRFLPDVLRPLMPMFEIVSVRAERVQAITEADSKAEGAPEPTGKLGSYPAPWATSRPGPLNYRESFEKLWDSINAKRGPGKAKEGFGWKFNPWVWRIEFRRVTP